MGTTYHTSDHTSRSQLRRADTRQVGAVILICARDKEIRSTLSHSAHGHSNRDLRRCLYVRLERYTFEHELDWKNESFSSSPCDSSPATSLENHLRRICVMAIHHGASPEGLWEDGA